ncbi:MAG TPA: hypothetical protein VL225_03990 [Vicinamibacterales bacterium]|nr:hypothetical protein [Vicinamibacterales bacterium]
MIAALAAYVPYAFGPLPPGGGSALGLTYGLVGFGFMVFVTLLSLRKKFPIWRIGRTTTWMRGHLWLGALSFPIILLHAGLLFGHGLTAVLMWLFLLVWTSGLFGAWLQHAMPRRLLREVPMETIYDQIGRVREQLLDEADTVVADACGRLDVSIAVPAAAVSARSGASDSAKAAANALATVMRPVGSGADETGPLREFYMKEMRPFVQSSARTHPLADPAVAAARFAKLRPLLPAALEPALQDLESICEEERQLLRQERMHGLLHGWLIVHVPLSFALMALAVVHIVMALRY